MIDNYIAIVTLHYQKISMRIFTILPIFNLTHLLVTILGADIRADHEDE
jgi:Na+/H+ antiporter NhaC